MCFFFLLQVYYNILNGLTRFKKEKQAKKIAQLRFGSICFSWDVCHHYDISCANDLSLCLWTRCSITRLWSTKFSISLVSLYLFPNSERVVVSVIPFPTGCLKKHIHNKDLTKFELISLALIVRHNLTFVYAQDFSCFNLFIMGGKVYSDVSICSNLLSWVNQLNHS